jgi:hypothetical protein
VHFLVVTAFSYSGQDLDVLEDASIYLANPHQLHLFGFPRRHLCSLAGTNLQPRCCPPAPICSQTAARRCIFLASRAGIYHLCSLAGTNLQPNYCPPLHLFGLPRR